MMQSKASRRKLLDSIFEIKARIEEISWQSASGIQTDAGEHERLVDQLLDHVAQYRNSLSPVPVSRCPFSGCVWERKLDSHGLDGLWWDYEAPVRVPEQVPETWVAFVGSLKPAEPLEEFPFLCKPGPEVPYILPHLINLEGVTAVLSTVQVGRHQGLATVYFSGKPIMGFNLPNEWGACRSAFIAAGGQFVATQDFVSEDDYDYDLRKYLDSGRLQWIAPGDASMKLRQGSQGCPYVDLPGHRTPLYLSKGRIWTSDTPPQVNPDKFAGIPVVDLSDVPPPDDDDGSMDSGSVSITPSVKSGGKCPACGAPHSAGAKFCGQCSQSLEHS